MSDSEGVEEIPEVIDEVTIGDTIYKIPRVRGLKAALAGALIARVMREIPQLQKSVTEFRREYRRTNTMVLTPAMAKLPVYASLGLAPEDFTDGVVELPEEPDQQTVLMNVFPDLWELADKEIRKFLAIIVIPNRELEEADDADQVQEVLAKWGKRLIREGDLDELLELLVVGRDVLREQMQRKSGRLGKLIAQLPFLQTLLSTPDPDPEPTTPEMAEMEIPSLEETPDETVSPDSAPPLSTDSPSDLGGTDEQLSMESLGTN